MLTESEIKAQVMAAFQAEQVEHCQNINDLLLELERATEDARTQELINLLFREAHSLKGGARATGLEAIERIAHRMEDVFGAVRQHSLELTPEICDVLYALVDAIGILMQQVTAQHTPDATPYQSLLDQLSEFLMEGPTATGETAQAQQSASQSAVPVASAPQAANDAEGQETQSAQVIDEQAEELVAAQPSAEMEADIAAAKAEIPAEPAQPAVAAAPQATPEETSDVTEPADEQPPADTPTSSAAPPAPSAEATAPSSPAAEPHAPEEPVRWETASSTVRLSTSLLDNLLNETGELITTAVRSQQRARETRNLADIPSRWRQTWRHIQPLIQKIHQEHQGDMPTVHHLTDHLGAMSGRMLASNAANSAQQEMKILLDALMQANQAMLHLENQLTDHVRESTEEASRLSAITNRLHDQIRATRMLPLTTLLNPLHVQVREMARSSDKRIVLDTDDGQAEADREVLDNLREVLLHLLRNAVDHGIEPEAVRRAAGKPVEGRVWVQSVVSGDYLEITVQDDGAGLDKETIKHRALTGGMLSESDIDRLNETDLVDLIFLPGFSTRHAVDTLSGRGVGLDIVRSRTERMHGQVSVQSTAGKGCTFTIRVPLSLTSTHGLLLKVGQTTYMLPLESIQRIIAVKPQDIRIVEGCEALLLDNKPVKLLHLAELLGETPYQSGERADNANGKASQRRETHGRSLALLMGNGERQVVCLIDDVLGEQELVIHRLPFPLQRVRFIAGATLLENGQVVPILDPVDLLRSAIGSHTSIKLVDEQDMVALQIPTIVVADDSITTRTLEKNILEAAGYQVHMATDGIEALDTLQHLINDGGCDLLLSDIDMPNLNGFELTEKVCKDPELKHVPVVLVTSLDSAADRERGMAAGASAYIVKRSFDQQELLDTIEQLV